MWTASCAASTCKPRRIRVGRLLTGFWLAALLGPGPAGFAPGALAADYPLEILELRSRLPEELIPILAPLAGPDGTVVGAQHALFVRASPERLSDIRRALAELDRPARSLLIQVRQGSRAEAAGAGLGVRVDEPIGSGDTRGRVRVGPPGPGGSQIVASAGQRSERARPDPGGACPGRARRLHRRWAGAGATLPGAGGRAWRYPGAGGHRLPGRAERFLRHPPGAGRPGHPGDRDPFGLPRAGREHRHRVGAQPGRWPPGGLDPRRGQQRLGRAQGPGLSLPRTGAPRRPRARWSFGCCHWIDPRRPC